MTASRGMRHGYSQGRKRTPEYRAWGRIRQRCGNPKSRDYQYYGARGIKVCPQWDCRTGFRAFIKDVGHHPGPGYSLDRIDNNGDYTPDNCRWATWKEQSRNRGNNHLITINGKTHPLCVWAEIVGFHHRIIRSRLSKGWGERRAVLTPPRFQWGRYERD